jgi:hypothetical protein
MDPTLPNLPGLRDDKWALEFINVAHLQSILEAIDDDGSGFVSIKEANNFAILRPKGWRCVAITFTQYCQNSFYRSLLHWIAFWAKGAIFPKLSDATRTYEI